MTKELRTLEYDKILDILMGYAVSDAAKEAVSELRPFKDLQPAQDALNKTAEAFTALNNHNLYPVSAFDDCAAILSKSALNSVLSCGELLRVARLMRVSRLFKTSVENLKDEKLTHLNNLAARVSIFKTVESLITENISEEEGVSDRASAALRNIRSKIKNANRDIKDKLNNFIKSPAYSKYLQDNIITVRGSRFCLSVKSECRSQIQGLVHDQSASGATSFIEPIQIVELNNQIRVLISQEAAEVERVLREYTREIGLRANEIKINQSVMTEADVLFAKAQYALSVKATEPKLNDKGSFKLIRARHPLIAAERVVPVDIELGGEFSILIVTGPNTGGKTVTLKTAGLLNLMAASGMFIPADEGSKAAVFSDVFCDAGDEQSISQNLSTFSGHITNIVRITDNVTENALVLLDELGAGTDPYEGAALAVGIIKYLLRFNAKAIITTHYSELKGLAEKDSRIQNASMQFDTETLLPAYRLRIGVAGTSCAMDIARHLGLNEEILSIASESADKLKMSYDKALRDAERSILKIDRERDEAAAISEKLKAEYAALSAERIKLAETRDKLNQNAKAEIKRLTADAYGRAEDIIAEIKAAAAEPELADVFELGRLKNQLTAIQPPDEELNAGISAAPAAKNEISAGAEIVVIPLNCRASVLSVNEKRAEAEVKLKNGITMIIPFKDIGKER